MPPVFLGVLIMKCGPENCPLTGDPKINRKQRAEQLYRQGFPMDAIAALLGVSHQTIGRDLEGLSIVDKPPRPKGGRPKGSKTRRKNESADAIAAAKQIVDGEKTYKQAEHDSGLSNTVLRSAVAREEKERQIAADPPIARSELSMTAQQKLDAAKRQQEHALNLQFETRVRDEAKRRIDEIILPHWKEKLDKAQQLYAHRRGAMDKATFDKIRRALHPDSRNSISDRKLAEAFDTFMSLEKFLLDEKDSPTDLSGLPGSWDEWEAAKRKATQARRAARGNSRVPARH
jgi:hypothetical protein